MTPAVNEAKRHRITYTLHQYDHDATNHPSYGLEAAEKLVVEPERVFKTLVIQLDNGSLVVAIVPVSGMLNLKQAAVACGSKKAVMADKSLVEKTTGYKLGGVSPLGQKKRLQTIVASSAASFQTIFVSGGRRGLEIELRPDDLLRLTGGTLHDLM